MSYGTAPHDIRNQIIYTISPYIARIIYIQDNTSMVKSHATISYVFDTISEKLSEPGTIYLTYLEAQKTPSSWHPLVLITSTSRPMRLRKVNAQRSCMLAVVGTWVLFVLEG
jgi:hypothetical protein